MGGHTGRPLRFERPSIVGADVCVRPLNLDTSGAVSVQRKCPGPKETIHELERARAGRGGAQAGGPAPRISLAQQSRGHEDDGQAQVEP